MPFIGKALVHVMMIALGLFMAATFQWKEPTSPFMAKVMLIPILIPLFALVRHSVRCYCNRPSKPPVIPSALPRPVRRQIQRNLRRVDKLLRQRLPGMHRKSVRMILDSVEEHIGVEIDEDDVPRLLVAFEQKRDIRLGSSTQRVA